MYKVRVINAKVRDGREYILLSSLPEDSNLSDAVIDMEGDFIVVEDSSQKLLCKLTKSVELIDYRESMRVMELEVYVRYRKELFFEYKKKLENPYEAVRLNHIMSKL